MRFGAMTAALVIGFLTTGQVGSALAQSEHGHQRTPGQPQGHQPSHGHQPTHGHQHGGGDAGPHQRVEAYLKEFEQVVADGRGFGLAFAADQNGYPGPVHVLELKDQLELTPAQEARMKTLFDAMLAEARVKAGRLAAAEARLRRVFAGGAAEASTVRAAVAAAETARADVRLVHLLAHLETREALTESQRRTYHQLRWGAAKNQ
jgi:Spy/CpxP family protein refolding chaperone